MINGVPQSPEAENKQSMPFFLFWPCMIRKQEYIMCSYLGRKLNYAQISSANSKGKVLESIRHISSSDFHQRLHRFWAETLCVWGRGAVRGQQRVRRDDIFNYWETNTTKNKPISKSTLTSTHTPLRYWLIKLSNIMN